MNMTVLTLYIMYIIYFPLRSHHLTAVPPTFKMAATPLNEPYCKVLPANVVLFRSTDDE